MQIGITKHFFTVAFLFLAGPLMAQLPGAKPPTDDPAVVVRKYCQLDLDGVGLDGSNPRWREFNSLVIGEEEWPDTPIVLVSGFRVATVRKDERKAIVKVSYNRVGRLEGDAESDELVAESRLEMFEFHLLKTSTGWKIPMQDLPPHVSVQALRTHIVKLLNQDAQNGDVSRKAVLGRLISRLDSLPQRNSRWQ